jgi:hypothetical protein
MAIAVVGHDARDVDAEAFVIGRRNVEKRNRAAALLSWRRTLQPTPRLDRRSCQRLTQKNIPKSILKSILVAMTGTRAAACLFMMSAPLASRLYAPARYVQVDGATTSGICSLKFVNCDPVIDATRH